MEASQLPVLCHSGLGNGLSRNPPEPLTPVTELSEKGVPGSRSGVETNKYSCPLLSKN